VVSDLAVGSVASNSTFRGGPAIEVTLRQPSAILGATEHRYSHYLATLTEGGASLGEFRILGHTASALFLSAETGSLPSIPASSQRNIALAIEAKFFNVFTNNVPGFPQTFVGREASHPRGVRIPRANVR